MSKEYLGYAFGHDSVLQTSVISEKTDSIDLSVNTVQQYSFPFKYVPEEEFARIVKLVKRNKKKKQEDKDWLIFLASKNKKCLCDTCPERLRYLSEKNVSVPQVSEQQHERYYSKEKQQQQISRVHIPQQKDFYDNPEDEIPEPGKQRKIFLEPSASLKRDEQNISNNIISLQTQINKCIHIPKLFVKEVDHNAEPREEFPYPCRNECCMLSDMHCQVHAESLKKKENSGEDIQKFETFPAEKNVSISCFNSVTPKFSQREIDKDDENGRILHVKSDEKLSHCDIQSDPNCVNFLPVEPPKFNHCGIHRSEMHCQICPTEENVNITSAETIIPKLNFNEIHRNGEYSNYRTEQNITSLPIEPIISKLNHGSQRDGVHYPNEDNINVLSVETVIPKLNICEIQRDGALSQRIRAIRKKIDIAFDNLLEQLQNIPEPDGSQDLIRRHKRAAEFSARFARNYLYHLRHQVCEIRKYMKESSSTYRGQYSLDQVLCQKLVSGHQTALQGLQAYLHHIPSSVRGAACTKIKELFQRLSELTVLCNKLGIPSSAEPGTHSIEKKLRAVLELIDGVAHSRNIDNDTIVSKETPVNMMTTTGQREWSSSLREPEKNSSTARGACFKPTSWKDMAAKLARAAYGSPFKKRHFASCKIHKRVGVSKTGNKKPSAGSNIKMQPEQGTVEDLCPVLPNPPLPSPKNLIKLQLMEERKIGDDIKTAVEFIPCELGCQVEQSPTLKSGSALKMPCEYASGLDITSLSNKLVEEEICNILDSNNKASENKPEAIERVEQLVAQPSSPEKLKAVIQQIQDIASNSLQQMKNNSALSTEQKNTVIGSKNAQLICLPLSAAAEQNDQNNETCPKESNNIRDLKQESKIIRKRNYDSNSESELHRIHASSRSSENTSQGIQKRPIDMHNKKLLPTALTLSKEVLRSAMNCRQNFQIYVKSNPMYEDTLHPWVTVERLSDKITDELLQEMASEAKLDTLINDMYNMELQGKYVLSNNELKN